MQLLGESLPVAGQIPGGPVDQCHHLFRYSRYFSTHLMQHPSRHPLITGAVQVLGDDGQSGCWLLDALQLGVNHQAVVDVQEKL